MTFDQTIYNELRKQGIPPLLAQFEVAKARLETDRYNSNVFRMNNNIGGYKWRGQPLAMGPGLKSPEGDYYARYFSIEKSAQELAEYIKRRVADGKFPPLEQIVTLEQYAALLKAAGYYGASLASYTALLKVFYSEIAGTLKDPFPWLLVAAAGAAALLYTNRKKLFR